LVDNPSVNADFDVDVASAVATIEIDAPDTATQGETIAVAVQALDNQGHLLDDVTAVSTITSSVASDVVDGNPVTFVDASPHTLTATITGVPGLVASVTVEVTPTAIAPTESPETPEAITDGTPSAPALATAGASPS